MSDAGPGGSGNGAPGGGAVAAPRLLNAANALTVARLLLVPVCVGFLAAGGTGDRYAAFAAFAVASMTDLADGELARRRNLITDFGKIADPIADKALTGSALVTLSALGELAWWITIVILARELAVTALRFWVIRRGVIAASRGGKIKTLLQVIAISLYILPWPIPVERQVLMGAAVVVTLSWLGQLAWWVTIVILVRELAVTALRFWVIRRGVIAASRGGKIKTMLQILAISLYVLPLHLTLAREIVMGLAVAVTLVTGVDYVARAIRLRRAVQ